MKKVKLSRLNSSIQSDFVLQTFGIPFAVNDLHIIHCRQNIEGEFQLPNTRENLGKIFNHFKKKGIWVDASEILKTKEFSSSEKKDPPSGIMARRQPPSEYEAVLRRRRYSPNTIKTYVSMFSEFAGRFPDKPFESLDDKDVEVFQDYLVNIKQVSSSTQNQAINAIKFYFEKVLGRDRKEYWIDRPRKEKRLPKVLTQQQIQNLLSCIDNLKHDTAVSLLYSSGLRMGELINLKLENINLDQGTLIVRSGKGNKDRVTIIGEVMKQKLVDYIELFEPRVWLLNGPNGGMYSASSVNKIIGRAAKKAGIVMQVSAHTLRHSFATHLMKQGTSMRTIQSLLGHNSLETTMIYTELDNRDIQETTSPLDSLNSAENRKNRN